MVVRDVRKKYNRPVRESGRISIKKNNRENIVEKNLQCRGVAIVVLTLAKYSCVFDSEKCSALKMQSVIQCRLTVYVRETNFGSTLFQSSHVSKISDSLLLTVEGMSQW